MKNGVKASIITLLLMFVLWVFWAMLELHYYGEIQPRKVDNIIGVVIYISFYYNVVTWLERR
jgi:hypothetical protein|nr:MAG TPA: hypothetical protein [Caudoviricetes sp.]